MKKIVLLSEASFSGAEPTARDIEFVSRLSEHSQFEFIHLSDFDLKGLHPLLPELAGLFLNAVSDEHLAQFKDQFEDLILKNFVHAIVDPQNLSSLPVILSTGHIGHFVVRKYESYDQETALYSKIITSTQQHKAADLQSLFPSAKIISLRLTQITQREEAIRQVLQKLVNYGASKSITQSIVSALDELLINALYDSKVDNRPGAGKEIPLPPTSNNLTSKEVVDVQFTIDQSYLGVAVTDQMGSLDQARLFSRIARSYAGMQSIDISLSKTGLGAGVGLSMVLRSGGSLFLSCCPGERTTATVIFKITERMLDFKKQFQFVSTQFDA